jgi:hypothetical protein
MDASTLLFVTMLVGQEAPGAAPPPPTDAQSVPAAESPAPATPAAEDPAEPESSDAPNGGQAHPPIVVPATSRTATARVQVTLDQKEGSESADFQAGQLVSPQHPDQHIVPEIDVITPLNGKSGLVTLEMAVSGLVPFGEMSVPLLYKGRHVETLRFHKPGIVVRTGGSPLVAHEREGRLLLVLENPSNETHRNVGVRVRFQDADVCTATTDQPAPPAHRRARATWSEWFEAGGDPAGKAPPWASEAGDASCTNAASWTRLTLAPASRVSLWVPTHDAWFTERLSGRARSTTRQGALTLRYFANGTDAAVAEHNLPLEVQFEPTTANLTWSIVWVGIYLLSGAVIFMVLRVSIPNYRRKRALKDALNEARTDTATISNAVDSQLRVLLRVERLALDQRRHQERVLFPGFAQLASRIEARLATLTRKIDLARRLDAATCRRDSLVAGPVAPTRLDLIERDLLTACDALKNDELREADWLFVQQRLEAADKALNEPSPDEKEAFEAVLSQRWQVLRDHFGQKDGAEPKLKELIVPPELERMKPCFPRASVLPRADDLDGRKWIASVGAVRADLQLTALERLRDVQILAPDPLTPAWADAMARLTGWLATPSIDNLALARVLLRQLSEPTTVEEIVAALEAGEADIEMDPQVLAPNQTVRLSVRFLDPRLNSASLRHAVQCEWRFDAPSVIDRRAQARQQWPRVARAVDTLVSAFRFGAAAVPVPVAEHERGWVVYRYFEPAVAQQKLRVVFFRGGKEIQIDPQIIERQYQKAVEPTELTSRQKEVRDRRYRFGFQAVQMLAALLVPLATLAITTAGDATAARWWDLVGIGFGSEAIRNILSGEQSTTT